MSRILCWALFAALLAQSTGLRSSHNPVFDCKNCRELVLKSWDPKNNDFGSKDWARKCASGRKLGLFFISPSRCEKCGYSRSTKAQDPLVDSSDSDTPQTYCICPQKFMNPTSVSSHPCAAVITPASHTPPEVPDASNIPLLQPRGVPGSLIPKRDSLVHSGHTASPYVGKVYTGAVFAPDFVFAHGLTFNWNKFGRRQSFDPDSVAFTDAIIVDSLNKDAAISAFHTTTNPSVAAAFADHNAGLLWTALACAKDGDSCDHDDYTEAGWGVTFNTTKAEFDCLNDLPNPDLTREPPYNFVLAGYAYEICCDSCGLDVKAKSRYEHEDEVLVPIGIAPSEILSARIVPRTKKGHPAGAAAYTNEFMSETIPNPNALPCTLSSSHPKPSPARPAPPAHPKKNKKGHKGHKGAGMR